MLRVLLILTFSYPVTNTGVCQSIFDLLVEEQVEEITIRTDFTTLFSNKESIEYQPGRMEFHYRNDSLISWNVEVRLRGNARRTICEIPPIKIRFSPGVLEDYDPYETLKVVNCCDKTRAKEQYVLREFLIYKFWNILTPYSFQVKLLNIVYEDEGKKNDSFTRYGFVIEHEDELADRLQARLHSSEDGSIDKSGIEPQALSDFLIFQYLLGNTDWAFTNQHNILMIWQGQPEVPVVIPYDFDYAGMVDALYALPHNSLPIETVRERFHKGPCLDPDHALASYRKITEKAAEMRELIENESTLTNYSKRRMLRYFDEFFKEVSSAEDVESIFCGDCLAGRSTR